MTPVARLRDLFLDLMSPEQLIQWLGSEEATAKIPAELPRAGASSVDLAWSAAEHLLRRGLVDARFFSSLACIRPQQVELIRAVERALARGPAPAQAPTPRQGRRPKTDLCDLLFRLYAPEQFERIIDLAGLSRNIDLRGPPLDVCWRVVRQAEREGIAKVRALEDVVRREYPQDPYFGR